MTQGFGGIETHEPHVFFFFQGGVLRADMRGE